MMLVTIVPADDPEASGLEVLAVGRNLEDLSEEQLAELLARAHPAKPATEREDIFSDTRARKKGERGPQKE
jgi:hypothetical protein